MAAVGCPHSSEAFVDQRNVLEAKRLVATVADERSGQLALGGVHVACGVVAAVRRPVHGLLCDVERAEVGEVGVRGREIERVVVGGALAAMNGRLVYHLDVALSRRRANGHVVDVVAHVEEHELTLVEERAVVGQSTVGNRAVGAREKVAFVDHLLEVGKRLALELGPHENVLGAAAMVPRRGRQVVDALEVDRLVLVEWHAVRIRTLVKCDREASVRRIFA